MTAIPEAHKLLLGTLHHIRTHPEEWGQLTYRCGTTMCVGGHIADRAGGVWVTGSSDGRHSACLVAEPGDGRTLVSACGVATHIHAGDRAARVAGLTPEQAEALFDPNNRIDVIEAIVYDVVGYRIAFVATLTRIAASDDRLDHHGLIGYLFYRLQGRIPEDDLYAQWASLTLAVRAEMPNRGAVNGAIADLLGDATRTPAEATS